MLDTVPRTAKRSVWLSVTLALLAFGLALRVRPVSWLLVLCLVPAAGLLSSAPRLLGFERSHPRLARACSASSIVANLAFVIAVVLHIAER